MKHIIVTGAANGLGRYLATDLLTRGYRVTFADADRAALQKLPSLIPDTKNAHFQYCDISSEDSVKKLFEDAISADPEGGLWGLVNNAGIAAAFLDPSNPAATMDELPSSAFMSYVNTNLVGTYMCSRYAVPYLRKSEGCVVNIASTRAWMSEPNCEGYAASKGGVVALTHAMAVSLGPNVRVNSVSPGWIDVRHLQTDTKGEEQEELRKEDHEQHPAGRVGMPEDLARVVRMLVEDVGGFITGQDFVVDGGMTKKMIYKE
ncbi:short-chain dehydrogenase/reductase SDR [Saitoella complicata NRRL Y-17804]|nr:short-chain dehydrogenase/reductase SDR [Saitoella complicata NRRL Y-17804]ODQ49909.1 short-chain dehydrogenase/reductase SDR [Saitoella complicata NRRL Y-17804]